MTGASEVFQPGDAVPVSGIYDVFHDSLDGHEHAHPHEATNKEGGVIIMVAGLADGHGCAGFYKNLAECKTPQEFLERVATRGPRPDGAGPVGVADPGADPGAPPRHHGVRPGEAGTGDQHAHGAGPDFRISHAELVRYQREGLLPREMARHSPARYERAISDRLF